MKPEPTVMACEAIVRIMAEGSQKDGAGDDWRNKPMHYHLTKGCRHGMTGTMIMLGVIRNDGEDHIGQAITRFAMALCIE